MSDIIAFGALIILIVVVFLSYKNSKEANKRSEHANRIAQEVLQLNQKQYFEKKLKEENSLQPNFTVDTKLPSHPDTEVKIRVINNGGRIEALRFSPRSKVQVFKDGRSVVKTISTGDSFEMHFTKGKDDSIIPFQISYKDAEKNYHSDMHYQFLVPELRMERVIT